MKNGRELAKAMESFVNAAQPDDAEEFANGFVNMHNTLEQMAVGMLIKTLEKVSETKYTDGRNEACVKAARLMLIGYKSELVKDLVASSSYWTEDKATEWVNGDGYDISRMPIV